MPGGIAGKRQVVEDFLRRLAAVEKDPAIHVVQLTIHRDFVFRVLHFHAVGHRHHIGHAGREHLAFGSYSSIRPCATSE